MGSASSASRRGALVTITAVLAIASLIIAELVLRERVARVARGAALVRAAAEEAAAAASARLELLALEAFAPAAPWRSLSSRVDLVTPALLTKRLAEDDRGRCRDILPAAAIFRVELPARSILVDEATQPPPRTEVPDAAALLAVAVRAAAAPSGGGRPASHVDLDRSLGGYAAITTVQYDAHGRPAAVYGLLVNAPALAATLFAAGAPHPILPLGRNALLVSAPDGSPLFGGVPGRGGVRATIHPAGALDAMAVTVVAADSLVP